VERGEGGGQAAGVSGTALTCSWILDLAHEPSILVVLVTRCPDRPYTLFIFGLVPDMTMASVNRYCIEKGKNAKAQSRPGSRRDLRKDRIDAIPRMGTFRSFS
jgi:hypothetical protein